MTDMEQEPAASAEKRPQERSPSFPYIGLTKALERAGSLFEFAKRHDVRIIDAAKPAWDMGPKSSSTLQTVAALLAFGLIESSGTGDARKVRLSDAGFRALSDPRPGAKEQALKELAMKPKVIAELREHWGRERPADPIAIADLHVDRGFTADGAKAFLRVYDDTVPYAEPLDSDTEADTEGVVDAPDTPPNQDIAVGDFVCVETAGQIVFEKTRVRAIDGQWVFVEASQSGAKMSDVTLLEKAPLTEASPVLPFAREVEEKAGAGEGMDRFTVDEGVVKITFPADMTADSVDDLEAFFALFIKKAKRRAGAG